MPRRDVMMLSGKIVQWLKKEGENVQKGEPVVLIEAEKTTFEIESQESGVLRKVLKEQGEDVPVGEALALLGSPHEAIPDRYPRKTLTPEANLSIENPSIPARYEEQPSSEKIPASPAARLLVRKHGIDLKRVTGTGLGGRIQLEDVKRAIETLEGAESGTTKIKEIIELTGIRKTVADRLSYSFHTTVPVMLTTEVDFEALEEARRDIGASVTAFLVKAVARALREHLILNSSMDKEKVIVYDDINVAVAINTPDGLVAPMIEGAEKKSLGELSKNISGLRDAALTRKLTLRALTGGTFTVTNLGGEGVELFAPIINPPQTAILGVGRAVRKPVAVGESVCIRKRAVISLIFDHRVTDGVPAAKFLAHLKRLLEDPDSLLDSDTAVKRLGL